MDGFSVKSTPMSSSFQRAPKENLPLSSISVDKKGCLLFGKPGTPFGKPGTPFGKPGTQFKKPVRYPI